MGRGCWVRMTNSPSSFYSVGHILGGQWHRQLEAGKTFVSYHTAPHPPLQSLQLSSPLHSQEKRALKRNHFASGSVPRKIWFLEEQPGWVPSIFTLRPSFTASFSLMWIFRASLCVTSTRTYSSQPKPNSNVLTLFLILDWPRRDPIHSADLRVLAFWPSELAQSSLQAGPKQECPTTGTSRGWNQHRLFSWSWETWQEVASISKVKHLFFSIQRDLLRPFGPKTTHKKTGLYDTLLFQSKRILIKERNLCLEENKLNSKTITKHDYI